MVHQPKKRRVVVWVDETCYVEGHGYRVSIVEEGVPGHTPTGAWPYHGRAGETLPWFWGPTLADAKAACVEHNARMGVSKEEAFRIVAEAMMETR